MWRPKPREWARTYSSRARGTILAVGAAAVALAAISFALAGPGRAAAVAAPVAAARSATAASTDTGDGGAASATPSAAPSASPSSSQTADPSQELSQAVSSLVSADDGHVSVAVEDLTTGTTVSDNVGDEEGGASAITAADKVFGLTGTTVDAAAFGDTTTTVTDQIALLRQAMTADSVLTPANRDYIRGLMSNVESDQRWGVSAAADDPGSSAGDYSLKNGWLPRSATNLWEINSIGEVTHDGGEYLVAVLSSDNESMDSGIDVVQNVAKAAVDSLAGPS